MSGIIRVKKDARYFVASNEPFYDKELSWEAKGVMAYLLSKPDNWVVRTRDLIRQGPAGEYKVTRILSELKKAGYIRRERYRKEDGTFEWETVVYELRTIPQLSTSGLSTNGLSKSGLSKSGKPPDVISTDLASTDLSSTEKVSTEGGTAPASPSSALSIYLSVTKIKNVNKIPEKVTEWLGEQEQYMQSSGHPEALRKAIIKADADGEPFNVNALEYLFSDFLYPSNGNGNGKEKTWYTDEQGQLISR